MVEGKIDGQMYGAAFQTGLSEFFCDGIRRVLARTVFSTNTHSDDGTHNAD